MKYEKDEHQPLRRTIKVCNSPHPVYHKRNRRKVDLLIATDRLSESKHKSCIPQLLELKEHFA